MTLHDQLCAGLKALGHNETKGRTAKYTVFASRTMVGHFLYVGKSGALRHGRTIADSIPVNEAVRREYLHAGLYKPPESAYP